MKILIVNYEYPPLGGGGGVATKDIAETLAHTHEVHVLTSGFRDLPRYEKVHGVHIHRVTTWGRKNLPTATFTSMGSFALFGFIEGMRQCSLHPFDVLNAQFVLPSGVPAVLLAKMFRLPFVLSLIGGDIYDPSKGISPHRYGIFRSLVRAIAKQANVRTAISHDTKKRAQQLHGVQEPIRVIPIGLIPPKEVPPASRSDLGMQEGLAAVTVGRLIPRKGYEKLIAAWKHINGVHLYIIGDGPLKDKLVKVIEKHQLQDRVTLAGKVSNEKKNQMLAAADMYVSGALHEGFGIVFLEAMHAGLPIVAPNDGGQTDFLHPEKNALLIDSSQANQIAQAVERLCKDEHLRRTMGAENKRAVQKYYIEATTKQFEQALLDAKETYEHRN